MNKLVDMPEIVLLRSRRDLTFTNLCVHCQKLLAEGSWAVAVRLEGILYIVADEEKHECCQLEQPVGRFFFTRTRAQEHLDHVKKVFERDRSTSSVRLLEVEESPEAVH